MSRIILIVCLFLASLGAGESPAPDSPQPAAPPPPSTLTGTLVSARDLEPVRGGRVMAFRHHDPETLREMMLAGVRMDEPIATIEAGADGRFRLAVPPSLRVIIVAEAPEHARARLEKAHYTGDAAIQKEIGRIALSPGRELSGRVISGEKPVAGATVFAIPERVAAASPAAGGLLPVRRDVISSYPVAGTTDEKGTFRLSGLPRKPVTLRVFAEGSAPAIATGVGTSSNLHVRLEAGSELEGKVVGPDGKTPVAGAWVLVGEEGWDGITRSRTDGSFRLGNLRPGPIDVRAVSAGTGPAKGGADKVAIPSPSATLSLVAPAAAGSAPIVLRLRPGGVIVARTVDILTRRPVAGARLSMSYPSQARPWDAVTGSEGQVVYLGVPAEKIGLYAEADDYLEENLEPRPLPPGQTQVLSVAMRPGAALEGIVRDESGRLLSGARVSVTARPRMSLPVPLSIFAPIGVDPVTSDLKGTFAIEKLPPGEELKIAVTLSGYALWEMEGVEVRPGERRRGLEVLLDRGVAITGRLGSVDRLPITVAEITAARKPAGQGSAIMILSGGGGNEKGSLPAVAPEMDGTFSVSGITPGLWSLDIRAPGFAPKTIAGLSIEGKDGLDLGNIVMTPGAVLAGEVLASSGEPIPFAEGTVLRNFEPLSTFTTAGDGTFVTDDLVPGELVTLTIAAPSWATFERAGLEPPMEDLVITLSPSSRIHGVVIEKGSEDPVPDFSVSVSSTQSGSTGGMQMMMLAQGPEFSFHSEDGTFTLRDVDPGKVNVSASAPGYKETMLRDLVVPEGAALEEVVLELERGAIVSGTVYDEAGRPLPGVAVSRQESSGKRGMMIELDGGSGVRTDGDGAFMMEGLDRAEMTLAFDLHGFETARRDVDTSTSDVEGLRVTMSRGASLSGIVFHAEDGSPVAGATVSASIVGGSSRGSTHSDTSASDGSFAMEGVSEGRYTLRAQASGLTPATVEDVIVTEGGASPPPIEIALGGGVTILGTVVGLQETELPSLTIRAVGKGGGFGVTAPVDGTGRFEVRGMNPGSVNLFASSGFMSGRSVSKSIEIPEGASVHEVTLEFPGGNTVEGIVSIAGAPLDGASVRFKNKVTLASSAAIADAGGRYVVGSLEDGDYDVSVLALTRGITHQTDTPVDSDMQFDIGVPSATILGRVTEKGTGSPLASVLVTVERTDGESAHFTIPRTSDTSGYYEITGLQGGTYVVTASKNGYGFETETVNLSAAQGLEEVSFELSSSASFTFTAYDSRSGTQLRELDAMVLSGPPPTQLKADASGVFTITSLQPGKYRLILGGAGLATENLEITVPGPQRRYDLVTGDRLTVQVNGLPAGEAAHGILLDYAKNPFYWKASSTDQSFTIPGTHPAKELQVKLGNYTIQVTMPDGTVHESQVTVNGPSEIVLP